MVDTKDTDTQVQQYTAFLNSQLRPQLKKLREKEEVIHAELKDYEQLSSELAGLQTADQQAPMVLSSVDLGYGLVSCNAEIAEASRLFVDVGMGFHVELSVMEAIQFVTKRIDFLRCDVLKKHNDKTSAVIEHILSTEEVLGEIAKVRR